MLALAAGLVLGCKGREDASPPVARSAATAAPAPAPSAGHLRLSDAPPSGDVEPLVRDALAKATAEKRRLVVYVGATWCEPCQHFHEAAERGELDTTFPDLTVLVFDLDRDGERLASAGYVSRYIPAFAIPNADGTSSGKQVEGGIKGMGAVAYIAPRLKNLLETTASVAPAAAAGAR
jgi:thiol-disulfide isomerase/thioredoxin